MKRILNTLYLSCVVLASLLLALAFVLPVETPVRVLVLELVIGVPVVWGMGRRAVS